MIRAETVGRLWNGFGNLGTLPGRLQNRRNPLIKSKPRGEGMHFAKGGGQAETRVPPGREPHGEPDDPKRFLPLVNISCDFRLPARP